MKVLFFGTSAWCQKVKAFSWVQHLNGFDICAIDASKNGDHLPRSDADILIIGWEESSFGDSDITELRELLTSFQNVVCEVEYWDGAKRFEENVPVELRYWFLRPIELENLSIEAIKQHFFTSEYSQSSSKEASGILEAAYKLIQLELAHLEDYASEDEWKAQNYWNRDKYHDHLTTMSSVISEMPDKMPTSQIAAENHSQKCEEVGAWLTLAEYTIYLKRNRTRENDLEDPPPFLPSLFKATAKVTRAELVASFLCWLEKFNITNPYISDTGPDNIVVVGPANGDVKDVALLFEHSSIELIPFHDGETKLKIPA